jgi:phosphoribosylaminoimidazole-succinocarboxamide synthase
MQAILFESELSSVELIHRGKVRDIYAFDEQHLLIVATDRISAFDVVLPTPIPSKGQILTSLSNFWFDFFKPVINNHLTTKNAAELLSPKDCQIIVDRAVIVRKLKPLPIEAIVRGYIIGSGWKDYKANGMICGIKLPPNLLLAQKLPQPIYTPSTKAAVGEHDQNIDFDVTVQLIGQKLATQVRDFSIQLYSQAQEYAATKGIIIADTKFEFGIDDNDNLYLIDEVLTPDSSRFWSDVNYKVGSNPDSFDKQFVRDYLESINWNKQPPAPELPAQIVVKTAAKYYEAQQRLMQAKF